MFNMPVAVILVTENGMSQLGLTMLDHIPPASSGLVLTDSLGNDAYYEVLNSQTIAQIRTDSEFLEISGRLSKHEMPGKLTSSFNLFVRLSSSSENDEQYRPWLKNRLGI